MQKKNVIVLIVVSALIAIFIFIGIVLYVYLQSPEHKLSFSGEIEDIMISEDGMMAYIKIKGGSLDANITAVKFIFKDAEEREFPYRTEEGIQDISVPFKRSFWRWLFGRPKLTGRYDYQIPIDMVGGLDSFKNINETILIFEYIDAGGTSKDTPIIDTGDVGDDGDDNPGGGPGPSGDDGDGCTNDLGCSTEGSFCNGDLVYTCSLGSDRCLDKQEGVNCSEEGKICYNGNCLDAIVQEGIYNTLEDTPINILITSTITGDWIIANSPDDGATNNETSQNNINFINITYTPDSNYNGEDYFVYNVSGTMDLEIITINITIISVDDAPILMTESYKTITQITFSVNNTPTLKSYELLKTEVDGDNLTFSSSTLPPGATLNPETGELIWAVSTANIGTYEDVSFSVTDDTPDGLLDTEIINITVRQTETYYSSPSGNTDTGDGSESNPWGTLESIGEAGYFDEVRIKSGDTLKLKNGYHGQLSVWKKANTDYITIEADKGEIADLSQIVLKYTDYWHFKGLRISPELAVPSRVNPENKSSMFSGYSNRFIKIENCNMYTVDDASSWTANEWSNLSWSGIVLAYTRGCTARNNIIRNVRSGVNCAAILTENNTVDGFSGDGMYVSANCILQDNVIINKHDPTDGFHNDGIQGWGGAAKNITLRNNYINARTNPNRDDSTVGGLQGMFFEGDISGIIENNVILAKNSAWGIGLNAGTHNIYIFNNTIMRPYLIGGWPNIQMSSSAINAVVKNNIADVIPSSNSTRNITSEYNLKITDYSEEEILGFFVDYPYGDVRPLTSSPMCDGSINGQPGVAVGALPCVEISGKVSSASFSSKFWNFIKSLFTRKTGHAITGNVVGNNSSSF